MKFDCNFIVVAESIPIEERLTGKELYNDIIKRRCEQKNIGSVYVDIKSSNEFTGLLNTINYDVKNKGVLPIIHFEMHGNKSGLGLKNGDIIN